MTDNLYSFSRQEAKSLGRLAQWKESHRDNIRCARDIENLIASHTQDGQLEPDCARAALDWWSFHRVQFVLSNTLGGADAQGFPIRGGQGCVCVDGVPEPVKMGDVQLTLPQIIHDKKLGHLHHPLSMPPWAGLSVCSWAGPRSSDRRSMAQSGR